MFIWIHTHTLPSQPMVSRVCLTLCSHWDTPMCVCLGIHMTYLCVCVWEFIWVCIYVCLLLLCVYVNIHTYVCAYICIRIYTYARVDRLVTMSHPLQPLGHTNVYVWDLICVCVCACVYLVCGCTYICASQSVRDSALLFASTVIHLRVCVRFDMWVHVHISVCVNICMCQLIVSRQHLTFCIHCDTPTCVFKIWHVCVCVCEHINMPANRLVTVPRLLQGSLLGYTYVCVWDLTCVRVCISACVWIYVCASSSSRDSAAPLCMHWDTLTCVFEIEHVRACVYLCVCVYIDMCQSIVSW